MSKYSDLKLEAVAIGSLPHNNIKEAMLIVEKNFKNIPFFPQLVNFNKNEGMVNQILEGLPSFLHDGNENNINEFLCHYANIMADKNSPELEKYAISENFSSTFADFEKIINNTKPKYAKGQLIGPFTLSTVRAFKDSYDKTYCEIIVKLLQLKVLWLIKRIKKANARTVPIIFMDEPSLPKLRVSAYPVITQDRAVEMLSEINGTIRENGGISGVHCCGKCDWRVVIKAGVDIINPDAWTYGEQFSAYSDKIEDLLYSGGKIAWGIVPTFNNSVLQGLSVEDLVLKFKTCLRYLTNKGIDEKLIIDNSLITTSCGAGHLSEHFAQRAMDLVFDLSQELKRGFRFDG